MLLPYTYLITLLESQKNIFFKINLESYCMQTILPQRVPFLHLHSVLSSMFATLDGYEVTRLWVIFICNYQISAQSVEGRIPLLETQVQR